MAEITRAAFTTGLNRILLVAAIIALVSGAVALAAIRTRDFAQQQAHGSRDDGPDSRPAAGRRAQSWPRRLRHRLLPFIHS